MFTNLLNRQTPEKEACIKIQQFLKNKNSNYPNINFWILKKKPIHSSQGEEKIRVFYILDDIIYYADLNSCTVKGNIPISVIDLNLLTRSLLDQKLSQESELLGYGIWSRYTTLNLRINGKLQEFTFKLLDETELEKFIPEKKFNYDYYKKSKLHFLYNICAMLEKKFPDNYPTNTLNSCNVQQEQYSKDAKKIFTSTEGGGKKKYKTHRRKTHRRKTHRRKTHRHKKRKYK